MDSPTYQVLHAGRPCCTTPFHSAAHALVSECLAQGPGQLQSPRLSEDYALCTFVPLRGKPLVIEVRRVREVAA